MMMPSKTLQEPLEAPKHFNDEALYASGAASYNRDDFEEAKKCFVILTSLKPLDKRYWFGLGAATKMLGEYNEAIQAYAAAALTDPKDPECYFHAAECFFSLGEFDKAKEALRGAQAYANDPNSRDQVNFLQQEIEKCEK